MKLSNTICIVDQKNYDILGGTYIIELSDNLKKVISIDIPGLNNQDFICNEHLIHYRLAILDKMMKDNLKKNKHINQKLTDAMKSNNYKTVDIENEFENTLTIGQ
jgi:hypothetical protein